MADARTRPAAWFMVTRDGLVALFVFALWSGLDAWSAASGAPWRDALAVVAGLLAGAALTSLAHEWGHLVAARLARARAPFAPARTPVVRFLFEYDFARNSALQFQWMSFGGNLTPWLLLGVLVAALGVETPGRVALIASVLGFGVFIALTEWPVMWRCARGAQPLAALGGVREVLRRNIALGALAALAVLGGALLR